MAKSRGAFWVNKKQGKQKFQGTYSWSSGERNFVLVGEKSGRKISNESWQAAKSLGWRKV